MKEPLQVPLYEEFTIPVVFHVVVSEEEVLTYGNLSAARIAETMERLNNIFSGKATATLRSKYRHSICVGTI